MITVSNLSLSFGKRVLFKDVNIKFTPGNCYGIIGANGAGKSTFMKILAGEQDYDNGDIFITPGERLAMLRQDQFAYDDMSVVDVVIMGHKKLYDLMKEREVLYAKEELTDKEGERIGEIEYEFMEIGGYEAETEASIILNGLGVRDDLFSQRMGDLESSEKVRVLLAQALYGSPDILLLDEPTNNLDMESIKWLEEFLINFEGTIITVSHDRHFLNQVCTHIADIDYSTLQLFVGNYDFWYEASALINKQKKDEKKKADEKVAELKTFIARFSSNASKSKQATSRKKLVDKLTLEDIKPSSRRFPYVAFKPERELGKQVLTLKGLTKSIEGEVAFKNMNFEVERGQKIAFLGDSQVVTTFFDVISGTQKQDEGSIEWGITTSLAYMPKENSKFFEDDSEDLVDWLRQYSKDKDETFVRGFLGRMLFSGEEALKKPQVLSGGEKVRCMLSRMMLSNANVLILDDPTNHLDLEAITALNNGLVDFKECVLFSSHDHQFIQTIANRIIEFTPKGYIDRSMTLDEYLSSNEIKELRLKMWGDKARFTL